MLVDERKVKEATPHAGGRTCIQLSVRHPDASAQIVDVPVGKKVTIGSGPRCHVCIQQPTVRPLHCIIVRDHEGLSVRRWAENTLLNGRPFDQTVLSVGDVLSVGAVDVDIIDASSNRARLSATDTLLDHCGTDLTAQPATWIARVPCIKDEFHQPGERRHSGAQITGFEQPPQASLSKSVLLGERPFCDHHTGTNEGAPIAIRNLHRRGGGTAPGAAA